MQIAIVHDYFTQMGGAEKVAEHLSSLFPDAPIFTTVASPEKLGKVLASKTVHTSWMQSLPFVHSHFRSYFMLYPLAIESLNLRNYDLILSSSSGYGKGVHARPDAIHVCYCHTPMRWAWDFGKYSYHSDIGGVKRTLIRPFIKYLQNWDLRAAKQPTHFIANSRTVAERIGRIYKREARVIYPPIDIDRFRPACNCEEYYIVLARLVSYKRIDLAVEACTRLGRRLLVIGTGPDEARLKALAGPTVEFLGRVPDIDVESYASHCRALLFPGEEDFGMAPLEIAAAGRPTIAFKAGGATETIVPGITGVFFEEQAPESLMGAIHELEGITWNQGAIRAHAKLFGIEVFERAMMDFLVDLGFSFPDRATPLSVCNV